MICPNCKSEIKDGSKFCPRCGTKIEAAPAAAPVPAAPATVKCIKCGADLKPGARFCAKCGANQQAAAPVTPPPVASAPVTPPPTASAPVTPPPAAKTASSEVWRPDASQVAGTVPAGDGSGTKKKKSMLPLVLVLCVVFLLALLVGGYFVLDKVFDINLIEMVTGSSNDKDQDDEETQETDEDGDSSDGKDKDGQDGGATDGTQEAGATEPAVEEPQKADPALLDAADALLEEAANLATDNPKDASAKAVEAANQYVSIAIQNDLLEESREKVSAAFQKAADSAVSYSDIIAGGAMGSAAYNEIMNTIEPVLNLANSLEEQGYEVDAAAVRAYPEQLVEKYREEYIRQINGFTARDNWSRDEAWNIAKEAYDTQRQDSDGVMRMVLFDENELDDPLRLRYIYCLAWISQKRCEVGIADGSMTTKDAFDSLVAILPETDYNLLVLQEIVKYGNAAGEDTSKYQNAYNAIVDCIKANQNFSIVNTGVNSSTSADVRKFWYFNDLDGEGRYMADVHNGTTAATREWIRFNIPEYLR